MAKAYEDFLASKEYKVWQSIKDVCDRLNINENKLSDLSAKEKDLTEYWEPFLERVFKLGVCFKQVGKLKEIRMHWIRPIFFMGSEQKVNLDGKIYEPLPEAINNGYKVFLNLGHYLGKIHEIDRLEQSSFKKTKKELQDLSSSLFKDLQKYLKIGYKELKIVIKDVLKPLRDLRRANYNYFCQAFKELGYEELNLLYERKGCLDFRNSINCKLFKLFNCFKLLFKYLFKLLLYINLLFTYISLLPKRRTKNEKRHRYGKVNRTSRQRPNQN